MTATELLAITSVLSGLVLGLAGLFATYKVGERQRIHERQLTMTTRRQQRLEGAYLEVLEVAEGIGTWASQLLPIVDAKPGSALPELPPIDRQQRATAKVNALGSAEVRTRVTAWREAVDNIRRQAWMIEFRRNQAAQYQGLPIAGDRSFMDWTTPWIKLEDELRPAELAARMDLADQIRVELAED